MTTEIDPDDAVEAVIQIEQAFGVVLPKDMRHVETLGDLEAEIDKHWAGAGGASCLTAMAFFRLRRALQPLVETPLRPGTVLQQLQLSPTRLAQLIKQETGLGVEPVGLTEAGCLLGLVLHLVPVLILWGAGAGEAASSGILPGLLAWRWLPRAWSTDIVTVGDLSRLAVTRNLGMLAAEGGRADRDARWDAMTSIFREVTGLSAEADRNTPIFG